MRVETSDPGAPPRSYPVQSQKLTGAPLVAAGKKFNGIGVKATVDVLW